jgi:hypothetical protein
MSEPALFRLHLCSALRCDSSSAEEKPLEAPLSGADRILTFAPEEIVVDDPEKGPGLRRPLPKPIPRSPSAPALPPGDYVFSQWRRGDYASIEEGFEDFIRQVWWEEKKTEGPWILRVVAEDGDTAFQGLRKLSEG